MKLILISTGLFLRVYLICSEFSLLNYCNFLLDTGSAISALSAMDLGGMIDYENFERRATRAIGVGGSLECYLIHNVKLFFFDTTQNWQEVKKFESMCLLPPAVEKISKKKIFLSSIIGRDIIGTDFDLIYSRKGIYFED